MELLRAVPLDEALKPEDFRNLEAVKNPRDRTTLLLLELYNAGSFAVRI
jgi:hypothetical protein